MKTNALKPRVDLVLLTRDAGQLDPAVERGIRDQQGVQLAVHRVVGRAQSGDRCRWDAIVRARNNGKRHGSAPWLMFLDDDVVLEPGCVSSLVTELIRRPAYGALAADYLGQYRPGCVARHVSMGATLFRREALDEIRFAWQDKRCECLCCCDDLRQLYWAIDYHAAAKARHLPKGSLAKKSSMSATNGLAPRSDDRSHERQATTSAHPSVCIVAVYFGPPPPWINLYLTSCAHNPSIDFLIVTDQTDFPPVPRNVRVKHLSESSFNKLASETTGVRVELSHPRKLCDFKPVYGHLFEDLLKGWDYWGYTDLDVIYGDIRRFLTRAKLQKYDVFTARKEFLVGHCTLFRNDTRMRLLYKQARNYQGTLQSETMLSFSECGKQWRQRLKGRPLTDDAACDSIMHVICRQMAQQQIAACFSPAVLEWPDLKTPGWRLRWREGRIWRIDQRREAMYFHFNAFRRRPGYSKPRFLNGDAAFDMTADGFERAP